MLKLKPGQKQMLKHAPTSMINKARRGEGASIAFERALIPSIAKRVSPPAIEATFEWIVRPEGGTFKGTAYNDGSLLDGPTQLVGRCGWAFVVLDDSWQVIAAASGIPPDWITHNVCAKQTEHSKQ